MTVGAILAVAIPVGFVLVMLTYVIRMIRRRGEQS
jgi:TRAP-type C4-dicarboxylate transport system permease small subunit